MPKLIRIEIEDGDTTFFFDDSREPFSSREFQGVTKDILSEIEVKVHEFNSLDWELWGERNA